MNHQNHTSPHAFESPMGGALKERGRCRGFPYTNLFFHAGKIDSEKAQDTACAWSLRQSSRLCRVEGWCGVHRADVNLCGVLKHHQKGMVVPCLCPLGHF